MFPICANELKHSKKKASVIIEKIQIKYNKYLLCKIICLCE